MYIQTTQNIKITAIPTYLEQQSEPVDNHYVWAYTIQLENLGAEKVQLLTRHWKITDETGMTQEVRGDGVIGEQPVLEPGGKYVYSSGTSLPTPSGIMMGTYQMINYVTGNHFDVDIPAFSLDSPHEQRRAN